MALPLKSGADFYTQELLRARLHNFDGDLAEYGTGSIYFNTTSDLNTSDRIRYRGLAGWHSVANLEDIARLEEMIGNLDFAGSEDFIGITSRVAALEGNFTNGAAKDAVKFGGQLPSYYATQSAFSALQEKVNAFLDGDVDSDAVLENLKEIQTFLDSYDGATSLVDLLNAKADKSQLSGYLPLSGGTISGLLTIDRYNPLIQYKKNGVSVGYMGIDSELKPIVYSADGLNNHYLLHSGNIRDYAFSPQTQIINNTDANTLLTNGVYLNATGNGSGNSNFPSEYSILMTFTQEKKYSAQISVETGSMHVRRKIDAWSDWKTLAFTDSNVASATKLATARSLWGVPFDGTADVNTHLTLNANDAALAVWKKDGSSDSIFLQVNPDRHLLIGQGTARENGGLYLYGNDIRMCYGNAGSSNNTAMLINSSGNVTIGNSDYAGESQHFNVQNVFAVSSSFSKAAILNIVETNANTNYIHMFVGSNTTITNRPLVLQNGYGFVGIGVIEPQYKLDIDGSFRASNFGIFGSRLLVGGATDDGTSALQVKGPSKLGGILTLPINHQIQWGDSGSMIYASATAMDIIAPISYFSNDVHVRGNLIVDGQVSSGGVAEAGTGGATGGSGLERVTFTIPANTTTFECEHNLGTKEISVSIYEEGGDYQQILADVYLDSTNIARIVFGRATDVAHKVVIIG